MLIKFQKAMNDTQVKNENEDAPRASDVNALVIRVVRCTDPLMWYSDKIGDDLKVVREDEDYYWAREDAGHLNIVHKKDAQPV